MPSSIPANEFATDTMGLVLRLERRKMGQRAKAVFEAAEAGQVRLVVPAMVFAEIMYLSEKGRIDASIEDAAGYVARYPNCREHPMDIRVIRSAAQITDIPELHDRLIAATAHLLGIRLITNDPLIEASAFARAVWR